MLRAGACLAKKRKVRRLYGRRAGEALFFPHCASLDSPGGICYVNDRRSLKGGVDGMDPKKSKGGFPWHILGWLGLYLVNFAAVVAVQYFFVLSIPAPLTPEKLTERTYLKNCEILEVGGSGLEPTDRLGKSEPNWVLYRNEKGETRAVRVDWNTYAPRFGVVRMTDRAIPQTEGEYTFMAWNFPGWDVVTVTDGRMLSQDYRGTSPGVNYIQVPNMLAALILLLLEAAVPLLLRKKKRRGMDAQKAEPDERRRR